MNPQHSHNTPLLAQTTSASPRSKSPNGQKNDVPNKYILPKFDFEHHSLSTIANTIASSRYIMSGDSLDMDTQRQIREGRKRYYGLQLLIPEGVVSPCINATDQARRKRRTRIRVLESATSKVQRNRTDDSTIFEDITGVLHVDTFMSNQASILNNGTVVETEDRYWIEDEILEGTEISGMLPSNDEDPDMNFEIIQSQPKTEQNGLAPWRQKRYWRLKS